MMEFGLFSFAEEVMSVVQHLDWQTHDAA